MKFSRFVRFYSMAPSTVLAMPAVTFWMMLRNIQRVSAMEQADSVESIVIARSEKPAEGLKELVMRINEPSASEPNNELDRDGLAALKRMR